MIGYLPDLAVKLQTLAEKCLIPIYKLPKFAAQLPILWQIPRHISIIPVNIMYEKKSFKIYIMN